MSSKLDLLNKISNRFDMKNKCDQFQSHTVFGDYTLKNENENCSIKSNDEENVVSDGFIRIFLREEILFKLFF